MKTLLINLTRKSNTFLWRSAPAEMKSSCALMFISTLINARALIRSEIRSEVVFVDWLLICSPWGWWRNSCKIKWFESVRNCTSLHKTASGGLLSNWSNLWFWISFSCSRAHWKLPERPPERRSLQKCRTSLPTWKSTYHTRPLHQKNNLQKDARPPAQWPFFFLAILH